MKAAAKLGISITVSELGSDLPTSGTATVSSVDMTKEWQPTLTLDEDGLLHQLRASLLQALDASTRNYIAFHVYCFSFLGQFSCIVFPFYGQFSCLVFLDWFW